MLMEWVYDVRQWAHLSPVSSLALVMVKQHEKVGHFFVVVDFGSGT
jgi:hypothetical protein